MEVLAEHSTVNWWQIAGASLKVHFIAIGPASTCERKKQTLYGSHCPDSRESHVHGMNVQKHVTKFCQTVPRLGVSQRRAKRRLWKASTTQHNSLSLIQSLVQTLQVHAPMVM